MSPDMNTEPSYYLLKMILQVEQSYSDDMACHEEYVGAAWWPHAGTAHNGHTVTSATGHQTADVGTRGKGMCLTCPAACSWPCSWAQQVFRTALA